jgi:ABC-type transport system involved in multi-copper enzyme maturation permease subunit
MLPLMRTTWVINRRLLLQFSPWLALYLGVLVFAQHEGDPVKMGGILFFLTTLITAIVTLQGLLLPVEDFMLSLPVSRAQVVRAKYLSSLLALAAGLALPLGTASLAHALVPGHVHALGREALGIGALAALYLAFGIFLFLPFIYRFGPARGFTAFTLTLFGIAAICLAWKGREACMRAIVEFSGHILDDRRFALAALAGVIAFGLASLHYATWTYRRKAARPVTPRRALDEAP